MVEETLKIHDNFSIELKTGFLGDRTTPRNDYKLNAWFFVPNSLDINRYTYSKEAFYRDLRSNIRLLTPVYSLQEIAAPNSPIEAIKKEIDSYKEKIESCSLKELEYHFKMFSSILKSTLRDEVILIKQNYTKEKETHLVDNYIQYLCTVLKQYRSLEIDLKQNEILSQSHNYFLFADEYISYLVEKNGFKLLRYLRKHHLKKENIDKILNLIESELDYQKKRGFLSVEKNSADNNRAVIFRRGMLKKYSESELYVKVEKKEDAFFIRQFMYSLAAGLSMILATLIAFSFQMKYGNFTVPLFMALVVGYMLKDRVKELTRYYFSDRMSSKYFDMKTMVRIGDDLVGTFKESFDFVKNEKIPHEVLKIRDRSPLLEADNKFNQERVMLYRLRVNINSTLLYKHSEHQLSGLIDVIRFNLNAFIQKMDDPEIPLFQLGENEIPFQYVHGEKIYYMNLITHIQEEDREVSYMRYRIIFNRDGIKDIEQIATASHETEF